jgi:hypothetical protein
VVFVQLCLPYRPVFNCTSDLRSTENSPSKRGACVGHAGDYTEWRESDLTLDGITFLPVVSCRVVPFLRHSVYRYC